MPTKQPSTVVKTILAAQKGAVTVRELAEQLGYTDRDTQIRPLYSTLKNLHNHGWLLASTKTCAVTGRTSVSYEWNGGQTSAGGKTKAQPKAAPKAKAAPTPPPQPTRPPLTPAQAAKAEAMRRAAERARQANASHQAAAAKASELDKAKAQFALLTGLKASRDLEVMKAAYRKAAMGLHPDRGGDPAAMATLANAWTIIKTAFV